MTDERIVAVAIQQGSVTHSISRPGRHHDLLRGLVEAGWQAPIVGEQGFLTNHGQFVGRIGALQIAKQAGQIITKHGNPHELYSEDIW